jgi:hypothetical protein
MSADEMNEDSAVATAEPSSDPGTMDREPSKRQQDASKEYDYTRSDLEREFGDPKLDDESDGEGTEESDAKPSDDADQQEPQETPPEPAQPAAPEYPAEFQNDLRAAAQSLGISDAEMQQAGGPGQQYALIRQRASQKSAEQAAAAEAQQRALKLDWETELKPDVDEPGLLENRKALQQVVEHVNARNSELAQQLNLMQTVLGRIATGFQMQQTLKDQQWFDEQLNGYGDDWSDLFGSGSFNELSEKNPNAYKNRDRVWMRLEALKKMAADEKQSISPADLLRKAVQFEFGDRVQEITRRRVNTQARDRSGKFVAQPQQTRHEEHAEPEERAAAVLARKMREYGVT